MTKYQIYDWAGNHLFTDETFESVDDGFARLTEYMELCGMNDTEIDEELQEYEVLVYEKSI